MAFSTETFTLLQGLQDAKDSGLALSFYQAHSDRLRIQVRQPFQVLFAMVAGRLPHDIRRKMVTSGNSIYGQIWLGGGAVAFYWGAFYPHRSTKKQQDIQLLAFLAPTYLEFGAFFGRERLGKYLDQFKQHYQQMRGKNQHAQLLAFLKQELPESSMVHRDTDYAFDKHGALQPAAVFTWDNLLSVRLPSGQQEPSPMMVLSRQRVLEISTKVLAERIAHTFTCLFPLVLLTKSDPPFREIDAYLTSQRSQ